MLGCVGHAKFLRVYTGFMGQMAGLLLVMRGLFGTTPYIEVGTLGQDQELMLKPTVMAQANWPRALK